MGENNDRFVSRYSGKYSHDAEKAEPGYYSVTMKNDGVKAELTVTGRVDA